MSFAEQIGWDRLRHGGLLLDPQRLRLLEAHVPPDLSETAELELRRRVTLLEEDPSERSDFAHYVLSAVCGFGHETGTWQRQVPAEMSRRAITGEAVRPRMVWRDDNESILPVFVSDDPRVGIGRGRRTHSQVLQWLRAGDERLAVLTNGRQWRLVFAGLDFDAWCEWDVELWFEEGELSPQVTALRTLLQPELWHSDGEAPPALLQAILDSRKGQAELSAVLGERVRDAVERLVQAHGEVLKERCADVDPADIYRAAVRAVMRLVVVLFAEARELLPRSNALYHSSYGLGGLFEELEKVEARGGNRLARSWNAWPRVLALCRLVHGGSHHPALPVPEYGGELFAPGNPDAADGLSRALAVFETACFDGEVMPDREVHRMLERITRTRVRIRQGRARQSVMMPIDFSDLSSEYIGILYEGLLDFELKTAPDGDPVIFLAVGNQPALPLSRLEEMSEKAIGELLDKLKDTSKKVDDEAEEEAEPEEDEVEATAEDDEGDDDDESPDEEEEDLDFRHTTRTRAEEWARRAAVIGKLVRKPRGKLTPERRLAHEEAVSRKARRLVTRVILPGEWYVVRWGGTRKGSGTFYTRPGLAVPTVQRTLRPLAYDPPRDEGGEPDTTAPASQWEPRPPEDILAIRACDPACGSGTFPVAALRFLTDALYTSLHHHDRIKVEGDRTLVSLLRTEDGQNREERLTDEYLPSNPDADDFEPRLKAILRRHVVERCIYGVDIDPLAVELCRLALWIETMDRTLPFSFLDHKIKTGNSLVGAWFDQFQHYPLMAWKNRDGGDKNHSNGVHLEKDERTKAIKKFVKDTLTPDIQRFLAGRTLFHEDLQEEAAAVHDEALELLARLHELPVHDSEERARIYREELLASDAFQRLKAAMDQWCACWFWPADALEHAPLPTTFTEPSDETAAITARLATEKRFFHWELEFPDVFDASGAGFDAILGNPPWDVAKPNSKEFFSNIDPLYRSYGKQEAIRYQTRYFEDRQIERRWLNYSADFRAQSNYVKYASAPFGDTLNTDKSVDRFSIRRGKENERLHSRWRQARLKSPGYADREHPFQHQGSADLNLYKLFLEQSHALLCEGGRLGMIVPSGLYSDSGTSELRTLFLHRCTWEWLFGFVNISYIFDIAPLNLFNPIVIQKGDTTDELRASFLHSDLNDWANAERFANLYTINQIMAFSPDTLSILEVQSYDDLSVLQSLYANSVLLGEHGPGGWGVKYATEFHMTNDSKLFPPRPKWEARGYRPDEYSRWLKGDWRPIEELWAELNIDPSRVAPINSACEAEIEASGREFHRTDIRLRCAQPPYDSLPVSRNAIPKGIILSREADAWIREDATVEAALPLYQGPLVFALSNSAAGYRGGRNSGAKWQRNHNPAAPLDPQYLIGMAHAIESDADFWQSKLVYRTLSGPLSNERTSVPSVLSGAPCGNSLATIRFDGLVTRQVASLSAAMSSLAFDWALRKRVPSMNINSFYLKESPFIDPFKPIVHVLANLVATIAFAGVRHSHLLLSVDNTPKQKWALTEHEQLLARCKIDSIICAIYELNTNHFATLIKDCDFPLRQSSQQDFSRMVGLKGLWRVDRYKHPEHRQTVLAFVAFHDLQEKIRDAGGDRDAGIRAFLEQNEGEGWMLPETLRLADYGLGHDERAKEHQPVASELGPRFYDWQLAQTAEESREECHLHARNMLGEASYRELLREIEDGEDGQATSPIPQPAEVREERGQYGLFR